MSRRSFFPSVYHVTPIVPPAIVSGAVPVAHALYRENVVKAWGNVTSTPTLDDSFNMTSVADAGTGLITLTFNRDFANATYCLVGSTITAADVQIVSFDTLAAGSARAICGTHAGTLTDIAFMFLAIGDQ